MIDAKHWSRGELEAVPTCPGCGSTNRDLVTFERHDNDGWMPDRWHMVRCADCASVWLDPRPSAESLPRAYANYYTHDAEFGFGPQGNVGGLAWRFIQGYLNRRFGLDRKPAIPIGYAIFCCLEPWRLKLDYYGRHLTCRRFATRGRLLDIGCGNGAFLAFATDGGWDAEGCEVDSKAVDAGRSKGMRIVAGNAFHTSLDIGSFDVITMSHVLEHVIDQCRLLRRAHELLRPGGWLWIALPNPESEGLRTFGSAWRGLHPPFHVCIPSQRAIEDWLRELGFEDIQRLRRGASTRRAWAISREIARRENVLVASSLSLSVKRIKTDLMSTFDLRPAEDTVFVARKPNSQPA